MDTPKLDERDREDILEQVRKLAASYTPEWRWDGRRPDAGGVLARIFAEQLENTISKYNRSLRNHYLAFLNLLGTRLLPPTPAKGMVTVGVIPGSEGTHIPQGTVVYAAAGTESGRVFYETTEAVYALDAEVDRIFFTSALRDSIVCAYDRAREENPPVRLFDFDAYPELQRHVLYFREDRLFNTRDRLDLTVHVSHDRSARQLERTLEALSAPELTQWEYHTREGWKPVDRVTLTSRGIRLTADRGSAPVETEEDGESHGLIRCRLRRPPAGGLSLTGVGWTARGGPQEPDALLCGVTELPKRDFSPFGDTLSLFTDFSLSDREVFTKAGAEIELELELDFFKTPVERTFDREANIRYRGLMTEEDFAVPTERDVRIERVLWEYWNGLGWARLFPAGENEDLFSPGESEQRRRTLRFVCPQDMADVAVGAWEGPFLRARIDKLTAMVPQGGNYIVPFVRTLRLSYHYDQPVESRAVWVVSNLERRLRQLPDRGEEPLISTGSCPVPAMYLCFTGPLTGGPVRLFWDVEPGIHPDPPPLLWEYYGVTANGTPGWKSIEVMDLTENATRSGIVTLVGKRDFLRTTLFGAEGYFLRLSDTSRRYEGADPRTSPVVRAIWPNTVPVVQRERRPASYFYIAQGERNKQCRLFAGVSGVEVRVDERGSLSAKEEQALLQDPDVEVERSLEGTVTGIWVPWREVDRLESAGPEDRVYTVDHAQGILTFGDGRRGLIPAAQERESIRVLCTTCDGELGNIGPEQILGFLNKPVQAAWVTNHRRIGGGAGRETIDQAAVRTAGELAGMGRIVTLEDFRRAALAANRNIIRVKCAAHQDRCGRPCPGALAMAVLPREYRQGDELFTRIAADVRRELEGKASVLLAAQARLDVFEVRYVELCVSVDVVIRDYNQYHQVHQAISSRLEAFLDPITGGFHGGGWEIGRLPGRELIYNCVKMVPNIKWVRGLHIFTYMVTEKGRQAVEPEQARQDGFAVPMFGQPEIRLSVE